MKSNKHIKVCHMTSAHQAEDTRIFHKECLSLVKKGYDVYLVARGNSYDKEQVHVVGVGDIKENRIYRMINGAKAVYIAAKNINADIYHFHDPELLPYGLKLIKKGKIVIFDSHEDVPAQIIDKEWIPMVLRRVISWMVALYLNYVTKKLSAIVGATEHITGTFIKRARCVVTLNNYPMLEDIQFQRQTFAKRDRNIAYAGSLDNNRGLEVIRNCMGHIEGKFLFASKETIEGIQNIVNLGPLNRKQVNELYSNSRLGIVIYKPLANHIESQPIKLFEYMAAGLPVVASNFPLWESIIKGLECGICVDPLSEQTIINAVNMLLDNPEQGQAMGERGRKAIEDKYNWKSEEGKLISLYEKLISYKESSAI